MVQAQETGTLLPHRAAQIQGRGPVAARVTMEAFATCVIDRAKGRAMKLIDMPADTPEYASLFNALFDRTDACISGGQLSMTANLLSGGMFKAMYIRDYKYDSVPVTFGSDVVTGYRELYGDAPSAKAVPVLAMEQFGECVARADAANARLLLLSYPGSVQEKAAFDDLMSKFSGCIVQGERLELSKAAVKGAVSEGLYRLMRASKVPIASTMAAAQ
jgi:hypothetical protein